MHTRRTLAVAALSITLALAVAVPAHAVPVSWTPPVDVSSTANTRGQQLATAPDGSITAIWYESGAAETVKAAVSADGGLTWSTPVAISSSEQVEREPQIAIDASGVRTVVWTGWDGANTVIQSSSSPDGVAWTLPETLSLAGSNAAAPQIAIDAAERRYAVWHQIIGGNGVVSVSTSPGALAWSPPRDISDVGVNSQNAHLVVRSTGAVTAIWILVGFAGIQTTSSDDEGITWSTPVDQVPRFPATANPSLAVGPTGVVAAIWSRSPAGSNVVQVSTSLDGLVWQLPVDISTVGSDSQSPSIAFAPDGTLHATWTRFHGFGDGVVQTSNSTDSGATWSTPLDVTPAVGSSGYSVLAIDPQSNVTLLWLRADGANAFPYVESATSTDGGATFPVTLLLSPPAAPAGQGPSSPRAVVSSSGVITAVWGRFNGTSVLVQAARSNPAATTAGPALAATGSEVNALPTGFLGAGLVAAGTLLVLRRRPKAAHRA